MMKIQKIYMRDVIALVALLGAFGLKLLGVDTVLDGIIGLIVGYYFSKRVFEEENRKK